VESQRSSSTELIYAHQLFAVKRSSKKQKTRAWLSVYRLIQLQRRERERAHFSHISFALSPTYLLFSLLFQLLHSCSWVSVRRPRQCTKHSRISHGKRFAFIPHPARSSLGQIANSAPRVYNSLLCLNRQMKSPTRNYKKNSSRTCFLKWMRQPLLHLHNAKIQRLLLQPHTQINLVKISRQNVIIFLVDVSIFLVFISIRKISFLKLCTWTLF